MRIMTKTTKNKRLGLLSGLSYEGGRVGVLLIHSLGGTPLELKYVAQGFAREEQRLLHLRRG